MGSNLCVGKLLAGYPSHTSMSPQSIQMPFYHHHSFHPFATLKGVEAVNERGTRPRRGCCCSNCCGETARTSTRASASLHHYIHTHPEICPSGIKKSPVRYLGPVYVPTPSTAWSEPMVRSHDEGPVLRLFHHQPLRLPTGTWGH